MVETGQSSPDAAVETEESFAELFEQSKDFLKAGDVVEGTILRVDADHVLIDVGYKSEGLIPTWEFADKDGIARIDPGQIVEVMVEQAEDEEGLVRLSKEKADRVRVWDRLSHAYDQGDVVEGTIDGRVKGGLSVYVMGVKAFLPGSQVDLRPVRNLERMIGEVQKFKIIKFNQRRGNIVLSRRALLETERQSLRDETLRTLQDGLVIEGIVKNITDYGAFIDLGGIDGLLHITDMSWGRISHPSELFQVGESVKVKVLKFDVASERVSLGLKQTLPDPWVNVSERYPIGLRLRGKVVSLADYGAFVELEPGIEGLIHISEMSWTKRVKHPSKMVAIGDEADVLVLDVNEESRKVSLGMKQVEPNPWSLLEERYPPGTRVKGVVRNVTNFGVFVGIEDGIDGLIHVSDISWTKRVHDPKEFYKKGDEVEAVVLKVDRENEKFSLGVKQLERSPWEAVPGKYPVGTKVQGKVTNIADFGCFVEIEEGIEGLIFASEIGKDVENMRDVVKEGDTVEALVVRVDAAEQKIALSIRAIEAKEEREAIQRAGAQARTQTATLGDLLPRELLDRVGRDSADASDDGTDEGDTQD
ncbi:MAG: 30S ribosomal protein S1 [Deltaproteobacteria bacterium]|nr:30S ribosomal protein S1 [Myxococcales bacterium]MCH7891783.1 30S ribosomal protein S1 [Gemmatimonadota bacterium]MCZ6568627.1 30S ribosomal protein S1 [Deltaproteobacteria bacterium]MCZ6712819.1 30S ribosomal protein S1 [Deltaproteobacteria bacterium]TDJ01905.1 MAG: 30S ribosomal protein S1 [Deltaproteobacteria bacterium]